MLTTIRRRIHRFSAAKPPPFSKLLATAARRARFQGIVVVVVVLCMYFLWPGSFFPRPPTIGITSTTTTIESVDRHIYNEDDAPFFNETVINYRRRLDRMLPTMSTHPSDEQGVFVSVASFRDDLCPKTLRRLFETAEHPERVFVGLCDQIDKDDPDDIPCLRGLHEKFASQVRAVVLPARLGRGPTHARYLASKLWSGEPLFMQIDSHTDFLLGWDRHLVTMLGAMVRPDRTIVTHYPVGTVDRLGEGHDVPWICETTKEDAPRGLVLQKSAQPCKKKNMTPGRHGLRSSCTAPLLGAGFFAGSSALLRDAPFDRYLGFLFHGEELLIAARLWTSGWDLLTPTLNIVSHTYGSRAKNVFDHVPSWEEQAARSEARALALLGVPVQPTAATNDIEFDRSEMNELGPGRNRSMGAFWSYSGVDLPQGILTSHCRSWYDPALGSWQPMPN